MNDAALNHQSRSLVTILRHQARNKRIIVSDDGFARVDDVLRLRRLHGACRESIEQVVGTSRRRDGMPRFELRQNRHGEWLLRAMRHHSMAGVDPGAEPSDLDAFGAVLVGSAGVSVAEQFRLRPSAGDRRQSEPGLGFVGPRPSATAQATDSPSSLADESDSVGVACADFDGTVYEAHDPSSPYLSFRRGESLRLRFHDTESDHWSCGRLRDGSEGWFPRNSFQTGQCATSIPERHLKSAAEHSGASQVV